MSVRSFFAIEPSAEARDAAAQLARSLAAERGGEGVRWVLPASLHVTLRFLGELPREQLLELTAAVGEAVAPFPPFRLALGGLGQLPLRGRPRVVVLGVEAEPPTALAELAARVERACVAQGLPRELRPFRPHLTLGRVRRQAPRLARGFRPSEAAFAVPELVLFESRLGPGGARYEPLARLPLGGTPRASSDSTPNSANEGVPLHGTQL